MIEDIITSKNIRNIELLKSQLPDDYCRLAAEKFCNLKTGNIILFTGFCIDGKAETDGPPGTYFLSQALGRLGYSPVIITDSYCKSFFKEQRHVIFDNHIKDFNLLIDNYLKKLEPEAVFFIELPGKAKDGNYYNCKGENISEFIAPFDNILLSESNNKITTFAFGDGGNEAGLGIFLDLIIRNKLNIMPAENKADYVILSAVSNWGVYGFIAALSIILKTDLLPDDKEVLSYFKHINNLGAIDGISHGRSLSCDSFPIEDDFIILQKLRKIIYSFIRT